MVYLFILVVSEKDPMSDEGYMSELCRMGCYVGSSSGRTLAMQAKDYEFDSQPRKFFIQLEKLQLVIHLLHILNEIILTKKIKYQNPFSNNLISK